MRFLLDTCVFAEFSNRDPRQKIIDWVETQLPESLYMSVLTAGEIAKGIEKMPISKRRTGVEAVLESILVRFGPRVLPVTLEISRRWGRLTGEMENVGRPLPVIDSVIAATALHHDLTIITRNDADFAPTGAPVLNIWK